MNCKFCYRACQPGYNGQWLCTYCGAVNFRLGNEYTTVCIAWTDSAPFFRLANSVSVPGCTIYNYSAPLPVSSYNTTVRQYSLNGVNYIIDGLKWIANGVAHALGFSR